VASFEFALVSAKAKGLEKATIYRFRLPDMKHTVPHHKLSSLLFLLFLAWGSLASYASDGSTISDNTFGQLRASPQGFLPPIRPVMDIPMRDPHAMLGPDAFYYLVGTQPPDDDPAHDFWHPYNGIRLFRSPDLKKWENLGYVFTLRDNATWQTNFNPGTLLPDFIKDRDHPKPTIWAPDIYYLKGTWWIAYSLAYNGWGSVNGMIKSTSGKPTGPYVEVGNWPLTTKIDAGLFDDDDGKVYFVWCDGQLALMNEGMNALAEKPRLAVPSNHDVVAFEGCALRKINGRYYMQAAGDGGHPKNFHGWSTYDMYVASSDNPYGPYGPNYIGIRNGGHNVMFPGKGGQWWATFFGWNGSNPFNEKPSVLPIQLDEYAHVQPYYNRFAISSPDARVKGVDWSYTLSIPNKDWVKPGFSDQGWNAGQGGFGSNVHSALPVATRTDWTSHDIWLRRHFNLPRIKDAEPQLALDLFNTGPVEVFINGVPAFSSTEHQNYYRESYSLSPGATKALVAGGDNVIAIHSTSGNERYIDAGLRLFTHNEPIPIATSTSRGYAPIQVDLGNDYEITRTDVYFDRPKIWHQYKIEYSSDGQQWAVFYDNKRHAVGDPCYSDVFDNGISADHVTGRYVKLTLADSQPPDKSSTVTAFHIFGHPPVPDGDLARGKAVESSGEERRYPAKNAVDGYWGSKWRSTGDLPHWLTVDLGSVQEIRSFKTWFGNEGTIYNYKIETSNDKQTWTIFADHSKNSQPCDPYYADEGEVSARYVRLVELGRDTKEPIDVRDFRVYGVNHSASAATSDTPASGR